MKKDFVFSVLITTKNRLPDLKETLNKLSLLIKDDRVEFIICDDGSKDGTSSFIKSNYETIQLIKNKKSKGLIFSRNRLLNLTSAKYAITLDDDAHIVSKNPLEQIERFFNFNPKCGVIAFRIFWGKNSLDSIECDLNPERVQGYVGCGHAWNMDSWRAIPNYPDWFVFYGEETFASFYLFKTKWEVWYLPNVLVHHRVDVKSRKKASDYRLRLRQSLRSGWYLYFLFYPLRSIPKKFFYTLWIQVKTKMFKCDLKAVLSVIQALGDLIWNTPKLFKNSNRLSSKEFLEFSKLPDVKIYWNPENKNKE